MGNRCGSPHSTLCCDTSSDDSEVETPRARRSPSFVCTMAFPMYVARTADVVLMTEVLPHQRLIADGVLTAFDPGSGVAAFVSHQWSSRDHPDPTFQQFKVMQDVCRCASEGTLRVENDLFTSVQFGAAAPVQASDLSGFGGEFYLWYDFFAVPQRKAGAARDELTDLNSDMRKAIASIPAYIERSRYFLVLAPEVEHADAPGRFLGYSSWKGRGWCRMERMTRVLSPGCTHMLLARCGGLLLEIGAQDCLFDPVGEGRFSVETDKEHLLPVVEGLLAQRLWELRHDGLLSDYRKLRSLQPMFLRGLLPSGHVSGHARALMAGVPQVGEDPLACFLRAYALEDDDASEQPQARFDEGLLRAAATGDAPVVRMLLDSAANLEVEERFDALAFGVSRGMRALHHASVNGHVAAVASLLESRAQLNCSDRTMGSAPLAFASSNTSPAVLRLLLQHNADVNATNFLGISALGVAAMFGREANVRELLAAGARPGFVSLLVACWNGGGADVVGMLLRASGCADPNHRLVFRWSNPLHLYFTLRALPHRLWGARGHLSTFAFHLDGSTPLHTAAMFNNIAEARALLRGGARADAKNARGATPADVAIAFGVPPQQRKHFAALARSATPDSSPRSPGRQSPRSHEFNPR
uniref:Ankyrin repeat domain-containing protein n=1 Tax=Zooxanthella nutricula TaxID=1333877 RepID=A0A7S2K310_9DINO